MALREMAARLFAERTAREAQVLLTFGSRPAIRQSLLVGFGLGKIEE
jgi:hypothetical protein